MTTEPDPTEPPAEPRPGGVLARWMAAVVLLALAAAAALAFVVDRGRVEQSDDVSFVAGGADATGSPSSSPEAVPATATAGPSPTVVLAEASAPPNESPTVGASPSPSPEATIGPTPAPTEAPPPIELSAAAVGIGETLAIRVNVPGAGSASVLAAGASYPLLNEGDGVLFGVVGIPLYATLGPSELVVTVRDDFGALIEQQVVPFEVTTVDRPIDFLELTPEQGAVLTAEAAALEATQRTEQFLTFDRQRRWSGLLRVPTQGFPTTAFGQGRSINGGPVGGFHSGSDIANEAGTPIQAAAPARVAWAGEMPIRGNTVILDHGGGVKTGYHHMQAILVEVGQLVAAGTVIGEMGSTGLSTGPHLHWELTIYGVNVDPMTWTTTEFTP